MPGAVVKRTGRSPQRYRVHPNGPQYTRFRVANFAAGMHVFIQSLASDEGSKLSRDRATQQIQFPRFRSNTTKKTAGSDYLRRTCGQKTGASSYLCLATILWLHSCTSCIC
ncbi:hypothetical protein RSOLAG1IB_09711 [Rhizoctonia solani AG-1 IB]|uniref:Uncharacterized protein n=1 Tax=Thanatephorus cucumeris (strain AG1-IB / isolate 7/3/14) TaxID=1108050 RepID=A0A0B7FUI5_THACB|nr:hypothetical protein RSOLAG1IB_09711 [Rhizoctonia solani AG-1 IB]